MADTSLFTLATVRRNVDRRFWGSLDDIKTDAGIVLSSAFSFFLMNLATEEVMEYPGLDPAGKYRGQGNLALYQFPTPPQQYELVEPAATTIVPTQGGGKFVESQGGIFKDVRIGGTVGFRPSPPSTEMFGGLAKNTGIQITMPSTLNSILYNDERGLHKKEATGFDDIIFLRNLFRAYYDIKQLSPEVARFTALVWIYSKESEAWVVEPLSFTTNRDSKNPLSWTYQIQCRTLYPLDLTFKAITESAGFINQINSGLDFFNKFGKDLARHLNELAGVINYVTRFPFNIVDGVLGAGLGILEGVSAIKNSTNFSKLTEDATKRWTQSCNEAFASFTDSFSVPGEIPSAGDMEVAKILRDCVRTGEGLLSLDFLWTEQRSYQVRDYANAYLDQYGEPPLTAGSPLNVSNITIPSSAVEQQVTSGDTIMTLAKKFLGNANQWKKLAILNGLKPPYISTSAGDGVLGPGSKILIPKEANGVDQSSMVPRVTNSDESSDEMSPMMKKYGRDIKLSLNEKTEQFDLMVNSRGDLDIIEGVDNVNQALAIKLNTEQGELATHPTFGAKFPIGTKFPSLVRLHEYSMNFQRTIRQDPRTESIDNLRIFVNADQVWITAVINLRGSDSQLPISFSVRR